MFFFLRLLVLLIITWRGAQVFFCSGYLPIYDEFLFGMTSRNRDFRQCVVVAVLKYLNHVILQMRDDWYLVCAKNVLVVVVNGARGTGPKVCRGGEGYLSKNYVMHFCAKWFLLQQADIVRFSTPFEFFACNANRYLMTTSKFLTELWKFPYSIIRRKIKNPFGFLILSYSNVDKWYFFQRTKLLRPSQYYVILFQ